MSRGWETIAPEAREAIRALCTPRQYDAVRLRVGGAGIHRISELVGAGESAVRRWLADAEPRIRDALPELQLSLAGRRTARRPRGHIAETVPAEVRGELARNLLGSRSNLLGDARPLQVWLNREAMRAEQQRVVAEVVAEAENVDLPIRGTAAGDPRRLRGLPAIGRNVSGHMNHTQPLQEVLRRERQREQLDAADAAAEPDTPSTS